MDIDYDYNDIIIYYLNNKFTDIDKNIKANYDTLNLKIKDNYETLHP